MKWWGESGSGLPFEEPKAVQAKPDMEVLLCGVKNGPSFHDQDQQLSQEGRNQDVDEEGISFKVDDPWRKDREKDEALSWPSISCLNGQLAGVTAPIKTFKITGLNFLTGWITNSL